ncbi:MAG: hypothetical protein R3Y56_05050, partial [Akkermansia sp.]
LSQTLAGLCPAPTKGLALWNPFTMLRIVGANLAGMAVNGNVFPVTVRNYFSRRLEAASSLSREPIS